MRSGFSVSPATNISGEFQTAFPVADRISGGDGEVVGGAGLSPLGGIPGTCELQRMYLLARGRGIGLGRGILRACLVGAREHGYRACYAETVDFMAAARRLYEKAGFEPLDGPLGDTGHEFPSAWYLLHL